MTSSRIRSLAPLLLGGLLAVTALQLGVTLNIIQHLSEELNEENQDRAQKAFQGYLNLLFNDLEGVHQGYAWWEEFNREALAVRAGQKLEGDIRDSWEAGNTDRNALAAVMTPRGIVATGGTEADFWLEALGEDTLLGLQGRLDTETPFERFYFLRENRLLLAVLGHAADDSGAALGEGFHLYAQEMGEDRFAQIGLFVGGTFSPGEGGFQVTDSLSQNTLGVAFVPAQNVSGLLLPVAVTTLGIQALFSLAVLTVFGFMLRSRNRLLVTSRTQQELLENRSLQLLQLNLGLPKERKIVEDFELSSAQLDNLLVALKKNTDSLLVNTAVSTGKVDDTNEVLNETQKKIYTITDHIHQTLGTVKESAQHAQKVLGDVQNLKEKADSFSTLANDLNQNALDGAVAIRENTQRITAVGQASERVLEILGVISDISERTHLLAINAAIEASRAGAHGKGFGVVASEIRTLSDNVAVNTREIEMVVKDIADRIREAISNTQSVGGLFEKIADQSDQNLELVQNIQEIIEGQTSFSQEMVVENNLMAGIIQELENAIKEHIFGMSMIHDSMKFQQELMDGTASSVSDFGQKYKELAAIFQSVRLVPKQLLERLETMSTILKGE